MSEAGPGQALFEFVRHWSRTSPEGGPANAVQGRLVVVVEAVHALTRRGNPATINAVARELGIDQSGASRWVTSAAQRGYLEVHLSEHDGRSRHVTVAPAGHEMVANAHGWQEKVFRQLTEGWSEQRRHEFHQAMSDMIVRSYQLNT